MRQHAVNSTMMMVEMLNDMHWKKKNQMDLSKAESSLLVRVERAKLLRGLVDPSVSSEYPSGYVASRAEVEMCYAAVTGQMAGRGATVSDLMKTVMLGYVHM